MEKKNPFKTVSKNLPFFPDMKVEVHEPFEGVFDSVTVLGDSPKEEEQIPVYIFTNIKTGEQVFIVQSYAIKKAVEQAKKEYDTLNDIVFRFDFKGKTVANGKPFNQFDTAYCTLEDWNIYNNEPISKSKK